MRRVVPEQVVGPAARLAERIHIGAAEEVGLHVHLLEVEFPGQDFLVHPLMARVETAGVTAHGDKPGLLLQIGHGLRIAQRVRKRDLDLNMLAGLHAGDRLRRMHLGGRAENDGIDLAQDQAVGEVRRDVRNAVFGGDLSGRLEPAPDQRHHLHAVDVLDAVQMLDAERPGTGERDLDGLDHVSCSPG